MPEQMKGPNPNGFGPFIYNNGALLVQRSLGLLRQHRERGGIGDGQLGQHLAVDVDAGHLQAIHQPGVTQAVDAGRRVDAGDPQAAEVALLQLAADVCIAKRTANLLAGSTILLALCAKITLGELKNLTTLFQCINCTLNSCP